MKTRVEGGIEVRKAEQQSGNFLVKEYLEQEMGVKNRDLEEVMDQVVDIFPTSRTDWKTLTVRFENKEVADWILRGKIKLRTGIFGENKLVVENRSFHTKVAVL